MADVRATLTGIAVCRAELRGNCRRGWKIGVSDFGSRTPTRWCSGISLAKSHPVRATVSDLGPCCWRTPAQSQRGAERRTERIFRIAADDRDLLLLDFKDLRAITQFIGDNAGLSRTSTAILTAPRSAPSSTGC
ncbi:DUF853 domain-containing protein [Klebsiella pneumoniae]|nr:DUF853 domain-containing protein [Klebsiella pneumoniae]